MKNSLLLALLLITACSRFDPDTALQDCRVRAQAAAGEYVANYKVCLMDRHHASPDLAFYFAGGEAAFRRAARTDDQEVRRSTIEVAKGFFRLARFHGLDSAWIEGHISIDSAAIYNHPR